MEQGMKLPETINGGQIWAYYLLSVFPYLFLQHSNVRDLSVKECLCGGVCFFPGKNALPFIRVKRRSLFRDNGDFMVVPISISILFTTSLLTLWSIESWKKTWTLLRRFSYLIMTSELDSNLPTKQMRGKTEEIFLRSLLVLCGNRNRSTLA